MRRLLTTIVLFVAWTSLAFAQPVPPPSPWLSGGGGIYYGGCAMMPLAVTGGCQGNGTINAAGLFVNGVAVATTSSAPGGATYSLQYNNGAVLGGILVGDAQIPLGQNAGAPVATTIGGDATLADTGILTVTKSGGVLFGTAAFLNTGTSGGTIPLLNGSNTWSGSNAFGTISSGTWNGSIIGLAYGGTGSNLSATGGTHDYVKQITSGGALTVGTIASADLPSPFTSGTITGNTADFTTYAGATPTAGNCAQWDSNHNLTDSGGACGGGGGSGTVSSGSISNLAYYAATGTTVTGLATANNGILVTSGTGVPSIATTLPSGLTIPSPTFSGTVAGAGTIPSSVLANTGVTASSYGSSSAIPNFTVNAQGQITVASTNAVVAPAGTLTGTTLASNVVTSSLATVGTLTSGSLGTGFTPLGNALLANSSITIAGHSVALGGTQTLAAGDLTNGTTGSGTIALATSPTLVTPTLGVASATSINKVALTAPASGSTLTVADGKTLTASNTITLAGTDATTWTGPSTNATLASLNIADQNLTGGANVTSQSLTTGSVSVDCGSRPIQTITNNGAYTITAPSSDGYCLLKVTNGASAGATSFSGFSVGSNTGDALTTTSGNKFIISIIRAGGDSTYSVKALQ